MTQTGLDLDAENACHTAESRERKAPQAASLPRNFPLEFSLRLGENDELEYRGPTSSIPGTRLPTIWHAQRAAELESAHENDIFPLMLPLPDPDTLRTHLDIFLEWQNSSVIILAGALIDDLLQNYDANDNNLLRHLLIFSIMSLTMRLSSIPTDTESQRSSTLYFGVAKQLLTRFAFEKPSIEVVQSACILACQEYARGYERTAWVFNSKGPISQPSVLRGGEPH